MKILIKILTPVHIGSGEEISPLEYVLFNEKTQKICNCFKEADKFIRLDIESLFNDRKFNADTFIKNATTKKYIVEVLPDSSWITKHKLYSLTISESAKESNPIVVKSFIKSAGRVFIPGSSLKGSILSALIHKIGKDKRFNNLNNYDKILGCVLESCSKLKLDRYSRWLDVTDSELKSPEDTLEIALAKVEGTRSGKSIPVLLEVLKPGISFVTEIKTSIDTIYEFGNLTCKDILKAVDTFYRKVLEKEKNYEKLKQKLPKASDDAYLIRIGFGSTCLSTSLLLLAEELNNKNYYIKRAKNLPPIKPGEHPYTKKLISQHSLGWAEIRIIEEDITKKAF